MLSAEEETYGNYSEFPPLLVFQLAQEFHFSWTFFHRSPSRISIRRCDVAGRSCATRSLSRMSAGAALGDFLGGSVFGRKGKGFPGCVAIELLTFWLPGCLLVFEA